MPHLKTMYTSDWFYPGETARCAHRDCDLSDFFVPINNAAHCEDCADERMAIAMGDVFDALAEMMVTA